jgi:hypothetical protein
VRVVGENAASRHGNPEREAFERLAERARSQTWT